MQKRSGTLLKNDILKAAAFGAAFVLLIVGLRTSEGAPFIGMSRLLVAMAWAAASLALLIGTRDKPSRAPDLSRRKIALSCAGWGALRGAIIGFNYAAFMSLKPIQPDRLHLATQQDKLLFLLMVTTAGLIVGFAIGLYFGVKSD